MKTGIWKLGGLRRGTDERTYPLFLRKKDVEHTLLICPEIKKWGLEFL
jgi:hypothetical protein